MSKKYTWDQAKADTLDKWKILSKLDLENAVKSRNYPEDFEHLQNYCGFCELFEICCNKCPLYKIDGNCLGSGNTFDAWRKERTAKNAKKMLTVIKKAIKYHESTYRKTTHKDIPGCS